jgi:hypothetical protein
MALGRLVVAGVEAVAVGVGQENQPSVVTAQTGQVGDVGGSAVAVAVDVVAFAPVAGGTASGEQAAVVADDDGSASR